MIVRRLIVFFLFAWAVPALAQNFTAVSATITDPNGLPYSNCSITAELVPAGTNPTIGGAGISGLNRASCDASGNFSMTLGSNAVILPGGTQWKFTVNELGIVPPGGTGPQSCTATLTISGASQAISASFSCPALGRGSGGTVTNAGVWTGSQFDGPYSSLSVNGCSPSAQYTLIGQPGFFTDGLDSCMNVPSSATKHQADAVGGYLISSSTTTNAVAGYFQAIAGAANTFLWGINPLCSDGGFANVFCQNEIDINISNADATGPNQATTQAAMRTVSGGSHRPTAGLEITNAIFGNNFFRSAIYIHTVSDSSNGNSFFWLVPQDNAGTIMFHGRNNADNADVWTIKNNGNFLATAYLTSAGGFVQLAESTTSGFGSVSNACLISPDSTTHTLMENCNAGTNYHPIHATEIGTCTMVAGTCTVTWARAFNATPIVSATWNGTGTFTTGASLKCTATTTNSVCTSSTGTDTAVIMVAGYGNPN